MAGAAVLLAALVSSSTLTADPSEDFDTRSLPRVKAGLVLGEPAGVSVSLRLVDVLAVHAGAGIPFGDESFAASLDLVYRFTQLVGAIGDSVWGLLYVGAGGRVSTDDSTAFGGLRVPFGATFLLTDGDGELYFELSPAIDLAPTARVHIEGGVGVRVGLF